MYRSIILELTKQKVPVLYDHTEQEWLVVRAYHDAMVENIRQREHTILYGAILPLDEG